MISRLIQFALRNPVLMLILAAGLLTWGAFSFTQLPIEAYPDVMNTQVQIVTQWPGHAAEEVEQLVTVPLETSLNGVPRVQVLRSRSLFGLSAIYVTFQDDVDDYFAHQVVFERISQATLPTNVQPVIQPISSATGEIYRYILTGAPLIELKTLEDWVLEREFKSIHGVADVNSFGGIIRQYQVIVDPAKLRQYDISVNTITTALGNANANAGGSYVDLGSESYVVRGLGLFHDEHDIEKVVVSEKGGTPLTIGDLATVRIGYQPRLGKVGWSEAPKFEDHDDAVEGIVLLLRGENPGPVLEQIHQKVDDLNNRILPPGVKIHTLLDRTSLVNTTTHTVEHNLVEGVVLVLLVLLLFLGNIRAAAIVALAIPLGLLFAFSCMNMIHVPANLLSLGAIDFGIIVNGTVILVENVYRTLARSQPGRAVSEVVRSACKEVESEIFFTTLIIILAYLPLFTMQSVEKKMFAPMAYTISLALVGSLIMALLVAPVLCVLAFKGNLKSGELKLDRKMREVYGKAISWAVDNPIVVLVGAVGFFLLGVFFIPRLGSEFLPHLDEGNLWIRATMPTTISYTEASKLVPKMRTIMAEYQPVKLITSQLGRPDDGTDATGFYNAEFLVDLKPYDQWKGFKNKDDLIKKMNAQLSDMPGISWNFSQTIEDNVEEAVTGVKGELAVKLYGTDLDVLTAKAAEIQDVMSKIPGVVDLTTFDEVGEPQISIDIDRDKIARYGLQIQDVQNVINSAIGGSAVTQLLQGERKFDVVVRFPHEARESLQEISNITVDTPDDQHIPLGQLAKIGTVRGASFIYRESNQRFIAIKFGVRGRDIGGAVAEAQKKVAAQVKLPAGYFTQWGGEFESLQRANARLAVILPVTLLAIFVVLFMMFNRASDAFIVMMNVPMSLTGGVVLLYLTHFHMSVSAAVGFIALFGIAVQNGAIMVSSFEHLRVDGMTLKEAIVHGAVVRLRPVVMTALLASIGLVPAALSTGIGSDVQKPLAIAIIGGLIAGQVVGTLFGLPVLYSVFAPKKPKPAQPDVDTDEASEPSRRSEPSLV